jgi:outer membrane protein assembly factor BamA
VFALLLSLVLTQADAPEAWPRRIDAIEVKGVSWTKEFVVLRELPWKAGELVSEEHWQLGTTRLWNTDLFSRIDAVIEARDDGRTVAVLTIEERFSLNPLFSFGIGGGRWWFRVGANDVNWFGRYLEWGVRYERFDIYNGGQGWLRDPRLFNKRLIGLVQVDYLFRPRPEYTRRRLAGTVDLSGELNDVTRTGLKLEVFYDQYLNPLEGTAVLPPELVAGQLTWFQRIGRVDTVRLRQTGWSFELRETFGVASSGPSTLYAQLFMELLWFKLLGERFNLAVRSQAGLTTDAPTELLFYLGGLDLVRGYADSVLRAHKFALVNGEARGVIFDTMWVALMAAVFVDGALAEVVPGTVTPLFSLGGGLRLLSPRLVKTGIRADVAVTLTGRPAVGFSFGVYQFF